MGGGSLAGANTFPTAWVDRLIDPQTHFPTPDGWFALVGVAAGLTVWAVRRANLLWWPHYAALVAGVVGGVRCALHPDGVPWWMGAAVAWGAFWGARWFLLTKTEPYQNGRDPWWSGCLTGVAILGFAWATWPVYPTFEWWPRLILCQAGWSAWFNLKVEHGFTFATLPGFRLALSKGSAATTATNVAAGLVGASVAGVLTARQSAKDAAALREQNAANFEAAQKQNAANFEAAQKQNAAEAEARRQQKEAHHQEHLGFKRQKHQDYLELEQRKSAAPPVRNPSDEPPFAEGMILPTGVGHGLAGTFVFALVSLVVRWWRRAPFRPGLAAALVGGLAAAAAKPFSVPGRTLTEAAAVVGGWAWGWGGLFVVVTALVWWLQKKRPPTVGAAVAAAAAGVTPQKPTPVEPPVEPPATPPLDDGIFRLASPFDWVSDDAWTLVVVHTVHGIAVLVLVWWY